MSLACLLRRCCLSLLLVGPLLAAAQGVGIVQLTTAGDDPVPVAVWYPTPAATVPWNAGPNVLHATRGAPVAPGPHPLVLLSHGSGGSEFGHVDLAEALAQRGYVVAAPRHLGDSYDRPDGRGSDVQLVGRPWQAVATLDAVLADPRLAPSIDAKRIGMAGFSAGGYTTLVMAGARPDFALHRAYCRVHADDRELCAGGADTTLRVTRPGWSLPQDRRVRAAVLMAPFSVMFDAAGVAGVAIPLRVYEAADDQVLRNRWNTDRLLELLPASTERAVLPGGHFVFMAPCSEAFARMAPPLCTDAAGIDRVRLHETLNREVADFFDRQLGR